ncbi:MAG: AGE family epimerase/isomerase, partial [Planctomycetales bacterium]|nr:AGE family epimerase/isomerase [Planctomycetales bacterium]
MDLSVARDRESLGQFYWRQLCDDVLPFWFPRCLDHEHGGYLHCVDRDGAVVDTDKSVWAHGRMSWLMLMLHQQFEPRDEWRQWGEHGLRFLEQYGFDDDGRMFFHWTREGRAVRKRRYAYSESFAAIAYAAHAAVTQSEASSERARELFLRFLDWNFTPGRMPAKATDERPTLGLAPRMIAIVTAQELRECLGADEHFDRVIETYIDQIASLFWHPEQRAVMESVSPTGQILDHFDTRVINPGHAIEAAWFILREADHRNREDWLRLGCEMLDAMWERGWDREYGGLFYFRDVFDRP